MKKIISVLVLSVFIGGMLLTSVGCESPAYSKKSGSRGGDGHGHSHN